MTRWVVQRQYVTADHDRLWNVIIHPVGVDKIAVKKESKGYSEKRAVLVRNGQIYDFPPKYKKALRTQ